MKFETIDVSNFGGALHGMRNPLESWSKSDSDMKVDYLDENTPIEYFYVGENDMDLAQRLIKAGPEHCKFLRQIQVCVDITAPLYWWKEFDTYKVGTTANSTSTMHKLANTPITLGCFEVDDLQYPNIIVPMKEMDISLLAAIDTLIEFCESLRKQYLKTKDKKYWKELIRWLPESWLQTRTVTLSYANLRNMIHQRKNHKLTEWSIAFIEWCHTLPYAEELLFYENN